MSTVVNPIRVSASKTRRWVLVDNDGDKNQDLRLSRFFAKHILYKFSAGSLQNILKPSAGLFYYTMGESFPVKKREKFKQHMVKSGELCSQGRFASFSQHGKKGQ